MDLLSWFRRIPGHDINVRIPSSPHLPHSPTDTVESSPTALDLFGFPDWNFSGGMDISIPIRQVIPVEAAKGIPSKRKRESSSSVRRTNWSGEHWWDRWDFNTPAHHQIMEKVIEDEVHVALAKAGLVASPIMTIPYWLIDSARYLLPEEEYTAQ